MRQLFIKFHSCSSIGALQLVPGIRLFTISHVIDHHKSFVSILIKKSSDTSDTHCKGDLVHGPC